MELNNEIKVIALLSELLRESKDYKTDDDLVNGLSNMSKRITDMLSIPDVRRLGDVCDAQVTKWALQECQDKGFTVMDTEKQKSFIKGAIEMRNKIGELQNKDI